MASKSKYSLTVASGVVRALEKSSKGISSVIDRLKTDFMMEVSYSGQGGSLMIGCNNQDILDLAVEDLEAITDSKKKPTKKMLGRGTIKWVFKDVRATHLKYLFNRELQTIRDIEFVDVNFLPTEARPESLEIECKPHTYDTVNEKIKNIESMLTKVVSSSTIFVEKKDERRVIEFEKTYSDTYYAIGKKKTERPKDKKILLALTIYGRSMGDVNMGKETWETVRIGKKPAEESAGNASTSCNTLKDPTGKKVPDNSARVDKSKPKYNNGDNSKGGSKLYPVLPGETGPEKDENDPRNVSRDNTMTGAEGGRGNNGGHISPISTSMKREKGSIEGTGDTSKYTFEMDKLKVLVYKESITEIKGMDALTNAANDRMMHGGGVAYYISKAAGSKMDDDCKKYIDAYGKLDVTTNYVSIPGKMNCKGIIHAVGPQWHEYRDKTDECAKDLHKTIINILEETKKRGWKRIALSAISSGIFGVPKILCAEMYVKAFSDFAQQGPGSVTEVHFIDVSREILTMVEEAHKKWVDDPAKLSFSNALDYPGPTGWKSTRKPKPKGTSTAQLLQYVGESRTYQWQRRFEYIVSGHMKLSLYTASMTELGDEVGAIACPFGGRLSDAIRKAFGEKSYDKHMAKYSSRLKDGFITDIKGETMLKKKQIIHVCITTSAYNTGEKSLNQISIIMQDLLCHANKLSSSLAMPLIVPGKARDDTSVRFMANGFVMEVDKFCRANPTSKLQEIHVVDTDWKLIDTMKEEYKQMTIGSLFSGQSKGATGGSNGFGDEELPSEYKPKHQPSGHSGWIEHQKLPDAKEETTALAKTVSKTQTIAKKVPGPCQFCKKVSSEYLTCGHGCCDTCFIGVGKCKTCSTGTKPSPGTKLSTETERKGNCPICQDKLKNPKELPCGHQLCADCLEQLKKFQKRCPECQIPFGIITGDQPPGKMLYRFTDDKLPGYKENGIIQIYYEIHGGKQGDKHPEPGQRFDGIERMAFLPNNDEGQRVLKLLRRAFDRKLIFTIGESRTSGRKGVVTWNDIHHKTRIHGGPERFGYPDETYLTRVAGELKDKGVTE